jgi:glyoxylase-like metal-dependent hydrolase (beta-lactamase superfamily II)
MERREPILSSVGGGITMIDTGMIGERELNAVYFIPGSSPTLVETGPGADLPVVLTALAEVGVEPEDLAHIVVTHIHIDHAGGAGALLSRFPRASVWAHERGVSHLVNPTRLVASTARTYGEERMQRFFGATEPIAADRVRAVTDGDTIDLGDRTLAVIHTPGHASHHVAFHDDGGGAVFTGEAIGSYLPWGPAFRPALPPPEVDVEQALASIDRIAETHPTELLTSHFGAVPAGVDGCARAKENIVSWSEVVRQVLRSEPEASQDQVAAALAAHADRSFAEETGRPLDEESARYDVMGSVAMNATGLSRYWRKRWEREEAATD